MSESILILDDEPVYAQMVSDLLTEQGYSTDICTHPRQALERLRERSYGLIISDYKMPDLNGAELLADIRRQIPNVPVIMISGLMSKAELIRVANIGVSLVLEKPFKVPAFLEHVARYVKPVARGTFGHTMAGGGVEEDAGALPDYPQELKFVAGESESSRRFLRQVWASLNENLHTLLIEPPGSEFRLLARECAAWLGSAPVAVPHFDYAAMGREDVRSRILGMADEGEASPVIALSLAEAFEFDRVAFEDFLKWTRDHAERFTRLRFLHALPDVPEVRRMKIPEKLTSVAGSPIADTPLRERLVDLSAYVERELQALPKERQRSLSADAAAVLLNYGWPGNHQELRAVLYRALAIARRGEISAAAVRVAIQDRHGEAPGEEQALDLAAFLQREQGRFIRSNVHPKDGLDGVLRLAGGRGERVKRSRSYDAQPLLFPELAGAVESSGGAEA